MLSRYQKGFRFEREVQEILYRNGITFTGNPIEFNEWKKNIGKGADIQLNNAEVELKWLGTDKIYPSYIEKDYIPRFKFNKKYKIVVVNNKWNVPPKCKYLLSSNKIKLLDVNEFIFWLFKKRNMVSLTNYVNYLSNYFNDYYLYSLIEYDNIMNVLEGCECGAERILPKSLNIGLYILFLNQVSFSKRAENFAVIPLEQRSTRLLNNGWCLDGGRTMPPVAPTVYPKTL